MMEAKSKFKSQYLFLFENDYPDDASFSETIKQDESLQNKTKIILNNKSLPAGNSISNLEQAVTFLVLGDIILSHLSGLDSLLLPNKGVSSDIRSLASAEGIAISMIMSNPNFKSYQAIYNNYKERIANDAVLSKIVKLFSAAVLFLKDNNVTHVLLEQQKKIKMNRAKFKYVINLSNRLYMSEEKINADKILEAIRVNLIKTINVI